jgi:hypothetical protein
MRTWLKLPFFGNYYEDPPPATPPVTPPKSFTQEQVNELLAKEKRDWQGKLKTETEKLQQLQQQANLTSEEKTNLQKQIEDLQSQYLTKEQQAALLLEKKDKESKSKFDSLSSERDTYKTQFETTLINHGIVAAAAANGAVSAEQLQDLLQGRSRVAEVKDDDGKSKGFVVMVKFTDTDPKTKQAVQVELPVEDAVKRMKELPERFGNLFKDTKTGGMGGSSGKPGAPPDIAKMSMTEYAQWRADQKKKDSQ